MAERTPYEPAPPAERAAYIERLEKLGRVLNVDSNVLRQVSPKQRMVRQDCVSVARELRKADLCVAHHGRWTRPAFKRRSPKPAARHCAAEHRILRLASPREQANVREAEMFKKLKRRHIAMLKAVTAQSQIAARSDYNGMRGQFLGEFPHRRSQVLLFEQAHDRSIVR
jgi:hypothetical protein